MSSLPPSTHRPTPRLHALGWGVFLILVASTCTATAQTNNLSTNSPSLSLPALPLGNPVSSILRVFGAFILVTAIFLAGVWLFRNWRRFTVARHGEPRLKVVEARSLGQRNSIYVVGYDQHRMLLAASPAGVAFLSHLPAEDSAGDVSVAPTNAKTPTFAEAFQQILSRKA
jgi:flagellar biogenesis protein FliO